MAILGESPLARGCWARFFFPKSQGKNFSREIFSLLTPKVFFLKKSTKELMKVHPKDSGIITALVACDK